MGAHGPALEATRAELRAGIAALGGDRVTAVAAYREANRFRRGADLPFDEALTTMGMVRSLGMDEPDVVAAVESARTAFERLAAAPFLVQLDALVAAAGAVSTSKSAVAGGRESTSGSRQPA